MQRAGPALTPLSLFDTQMMPSKHGSSHRSLAEFRAMQFLADHGQLADASIFSETYHCDAIMVKPCQLRAMSLDKFHELVKDMPELRDQLASYLAERLQAARTQAAILSLKTIDQRLDAWLGTPQNRMPKRGKWQDLADMLAVTPEALYRELAKRRRVKGPR